VDKKVPLEEKGFIKQYLEHANSLEHPTHTYVSLGMDFWRGGSWSEEGAVEDRFLRFLKTNNPKIYMGEVNGKHSEVTAPFNKLLNTTSTDYYKVEAYADDPPMCLYDTYHENEDWKREREKEKEKERKTKRARTSTPEKEPVVEEVV
jgi:hypothetical protein